MSSHPQITRNAFFFLTQGRGKLYQITTTIVTLSTTDSVATLLKFFSPMLCGRRTDVSSPMFACDMDVCIFDASGSQQQQRRGETGNVSASRFMYIVCCWFVWSRARISVATDGIAFDDDNVWARELACEFFLLSCLSCSVHDLSAASRTVCNFGCFPVCCLVSGLQTGKQIGWRTIAVIVDDGNSHAYWFEIQTILFDDRWWRIRDFEVFLQQSSSGFDMNLNLELILKSYWQYCW